MSRHKKAEKHAKKLDKKDLAKELEGAEKFGKKKSAKKAARGKKR